MASKDPEGGEGIQTSCVPADMERQARARHLRAESLPKSAALARKSCLAVGVRLLGAFPSLPATCNSMSLKNRWIRSLEKRRGLDRDLVMDGFLSLQVIGPERAETNSECLSQERIAEKVRGGL